MHTSKMCKLKKIHYILYCMFFNQKAWKSWKCLPRKCWGECFNISTQKWQSNNSIQSSKYCGASWFILYALNLGNWIKQDMTCRMRRGFRKCKHNFDRRNKREEVISTYRRIILGRNIEVQGLGISTGFRWLRRFLVETVQDLAKWGCAFWIRLQSYRQGCVIAVLNILGQKVTASKWNKKLIVAI
jgi:hypothetical protein